MMEVTRLVQKGSKCAAIISSMSEMYHISLEEATDIYYDSETSTLIDEGVADLHCRSERYLASLVWDEYKEKG